MFLQQVNALHDLVKGRHTLAIPAILVVEGLRTINGDSYQKMVLFEEPAPFVVQEGPVGLDAVVDASDAEDTASGGGVLLGLTVEGGAAVEDDDVGDGVGLGNA